MLRWASPLTVACFQTDDPGSWYSTLNWVTMPVYGPNDLPCISKATNAAGKSGSKSTCMYSVPPESMLDFPDAHQVPGPLPFATRPSDDGLAMQ